MDSEPIAFGKAPDTFSSIAADVVTAAQWKLYAFALLIFIFVSSDLFLNVIRRVPSAIKLDLPTNYGVFLQGLTLTLLLILADVAIHQGVV